VKKLIPTVINSLINIFSFFFFYAIITFTYYKSEEEYATTSSPTMVQRLAKEGTVKRVVQDLIDAFGLDLPAWLQILLFLILFVFFIEFLKFTYKKLISLFKKK
jgi:TRAP-type C4-dicarboxylate transport system permease small subunit